MLKGHFDFCQQGSTFFALRLLKCSKYAMHGNQCYVCEEKCNIYLLFY